MRFPSIIYLLQISSCPSKSSIFNVNWTLRKKKTASQKNFTSDDEMPLSHFQALNDQDISLDKLNIARYENIYKRLYE